MIIMTRVVYILMLFIIIACSYNKYHRVINIASIFSFIWLLFGFISTFGFYGLRVPVLKIHLYVWSFVFCVVTTILLEKNSVQTKQQNNISFDIYMKRAKLVQIVSLILIMPLVFFSIRSMVRTGSFTGARHIYYTEGYFNSLYLEFVFKTVPMACCSAMNIVYCFAAFELGKVKYMFVALSDAFILVFISGGRYSILSFIYCVFLLLFLSNKNNVQNMSLKLGKKAKKLIVFGVIILSLVTTIRGQDILKEFVKYFSGSFSYLDLILSNPSDFGLNSYTYGYLTFGAFFEPIVLVLKALGFDTPNIPAYQINIYCQTFHNIGKDVRIMYNANTTILYYFISDLGFLGILIGGILIGKVISITHNKWQMHSLFGSLLFLYFMIVALNSTMIYQFFGQGAIIILTVFWFITQKKITYGNR